jgi:hypothetical protein
MSVNAGGATGNPNAAAAAAAATAAADFPQRRNSSSMSTNAAKGVVYVECLDLTQDDDVVHSTIQGVQTKDHATTAETKTVECLDLTQNDDVPYLSQKRVQQKSATATYSTSEEALEAILKKRMKKRSRAARRNKRYKASMIDLTEDEVAHTSAPTWAAPYSG